MGFTAVSLLARTSRTRRSIGGNIVMSIVETIKSMKFSPWKPISEKEINKAENELKVTFAMEYREYLFAFGQADVNGVELTGIIDSKRLNVVSATINERELNPDNIPENFYLIANTGMDGIIIWQDSKGFIYKSKPLQKPVKIFNSLNDYLKGLNL